MFPEFKVFGLTVYTYGLFTGIGLAALFVFAYAAYYIRTRDGVSVIFITLFAALGAFVGMHLLYGITNIRLWGKLLEASDVIDFFRRFAVLFGGSVFYGGLFGGLAGGILCAKHRRLDLKTVCDVYAPAAALFHAFGRVGCFMAGCCYGTEHENGVVFTSSAAPGANGVPRFPVQLVEAGFELMTAVVLTVFLVKKAFSGRLMAIYLTVYPAARFVLEYFRGDEYRGFVFGLSTSQLISAVLLVLSAAYWIKTRPRRSRKASDNENFFT